MSGIPLEYWTGLGAAMPTGRADPAACARLRNAVEQYGMWSKQPDSSTSIAQRAKYKKEWDALKAQRACRPAPTSAPAPAPPRPADGPGRVQIDPRQAPQSAPRTVLPAYTIPRRGSVGFESKLTPLTDLFSPGRPAQRQPSLSIAQVPTWAWVAAGTVTLLLVGGAVKKRFAS